MAPRRRSVVTAFGREVGRHSILLLAVLALGQTGLRAAGECTADRARQAASAIGCLQPEQLEAVLGYQNPAGDEHVLREGLAAAAGVAACIDNVTIFPSNPEPREDFHCLQEKLLDFYGELAFPDGRTVELHYQDLFARASLRFHYSLLDTDLSIPEALRLVEDSLRDYQSVFRAAGEIRKSPSARESLELAEKLGMRPASPIPEYHYLEEFAAMAATNARRFPRAIGNELGAALGPALCEAYQLYPNRRARIAHLYNVLVRFDLGNMAAAGQLDSYLARIEDFFRPPAQLFSYLRLEPADWSPTAPPCGEPDWMLVFPEFKPLAGLRLPPPETVGESLSEMENLLLRTAELADNRNHLWKVFLRHGELLFRLAESLKVGAARHPSIQSTRHLLMEKARDAFLLRGVSASRHPLDPGQLYAAIDQQIAGYCGQLLRDLQFDALIPFVETYLDAGETFLSPPQIQQLHRQLAIAYTLLDDPAQALAHRQKADLTQTQLDAMRNALREFGVGVEVKIEGR